MIEPKHSTDWLTKQANAAFRQASEKVIKEARLSNTEIVVWKNGKVCHITADEAERDLKLQAIDEPSCPNP